MINLVKEIVGYLFFITLFKRSKKEDVSQSIFNVFIVTTLALVPIWVGFFWEWAKEGFELSNFMKPLWDSILRGELFIVCLSFSAPVFIHVTSQTPDHRIVNKQFLLFQSFVASLMNLSMFLGLKSSLQAQVNEKILITISIVMFFYVTFLTFIATLSNVVSKNFNFNTTSEEMSIEDNSFQSSLRKTREKQEEKK